MKLNYLFDLYAKKIPPMIANQLDSIWVADNTRKLFGDNKWTELNIALGRTLIGSHHRLYFLLDKHS